MLELICFIRVCDAQSVQIARASNLELGHVPSLFNLDRPSVLTTCYKEKLLDFLNPLWLQQSNNNQYTVTSNLYVFPYRSSQQPNQSTTVLFQEPTLVDNKTHDSKNGIYIDAYKKQIKESIPGQRQIPHQPTE